MNILIVDDHEESRMILAEALKDSGYEITTAENGLIALDFIEKRAPDMVITDIHMPEMDGFQLCRKLKSQKQWQHIPLIFFTATYTGIDDELFAKEIGADGFIRKPINMDNFIRIIQKMIGKIVHQPSPHPSMSANEITDQVADIDDAGEMQTIEKESAVEMELVSLSDRYRILFHYSENAIFIFDQDHKVLEVNHTACLHLGYTSDELVGTPIVDLIDPKHQNGFIPHWQSVNTDRIIEWEGNFFHKDGFPIYYKGHLHAIRYGKSIVMMALLQNLTELKKAQEEREKLNARLLHAQRMEAIETLAGGIAHDLNNILFPIIGYAEMAMDDLDADSPLQGHITQIFKAANRAKDLIWQILAFSRQNEQDRVPIRLHHVVKEVLRLIRASLPATIEIIETIQECPPIMADAGQIHQVLLNLCNNAFHAMESTGGVLEIRLERALISPDDPIASEMAPGPCIQLSVSDTGHGMEREVMDRIFDPYFSTKSRSKGTGLGLAMVHGTVKSHNGYVKAYSEPGCGTTIQVFFPVIKENGTEVALQGHSAIPTGNERILLVEDEPQMMGMLQELLSRMGYRISGFNSPIEALKVFSSSPNRFDLIITDLTMPKMTGIQLAAEVEKIRPDLPVLLCTGFSDSSIPNHNLPANIHKVLMKPILKNDLAKAIREALETRG